MDKLTHARVNVSRAVARLRALGCTVHTVIGHDPLGGRYIYGIVPPDGIPFASVSEPFTTQVGEYAESGTFVQATLRPHLFGGSRVIATCSPENAHRVRRETAIAITDVLLALSGRIEQYDTSGSASRQHYIETGLYLRRDEV